MPQINNSIIWKVISLSGWFISIVLLMTLLKIHNDIEIQEFEKGINLLSDDLIEDIIKTKKKQVLIKNFQNFKNTETPLGKFVTTNLVSSINKKDNSIVFVNREYIEDITLEQRLTRSGLTRMQDISEVGALIGGQLVVTGKTELSNNELAISVQMTDIESGRIITSRNSKLLSDQMINSFADDNHQFNKCFFIILDKINTFISDNFQWLWAAILVPIMGWIWNSKRKKHEEKLKNM